jgi:hypothetical protein
VGGGFKLCTTTVCGYKAHSDVSRAAAAVSGRRRAAHYVQVAGVIDAEYDLAVRDDRRHSNVELASTRAAIASTLAAVFLDPDPDIARQIHAKRKTQTQGAEFRRVFAREFGAVGQVLGGVSQGLADRTGAVLLLAGETLLTKVLKRERLGGRPGKGQLEQNE